MINRIEADDRSLVIRSYPTFIAAFCIVVLGAVVIQSARGRIGWVDAAIPTFVVVVAMSLLEYKVATFRVGEPSVLVQSVRPIHRKETEVPLNQISSVNRNTGGGGAAHAGVVELQTREGKISVTSVGAMSPRKQVAVLEAIRGFLSRSQ
ncbi:hypothetical protein [Rhodopirellula sallentina]|uniref:Membrane protein n=1 Tax=Rhodopirellula sallentina SM41 TaxID=1263870 RepID=M5U7Q8_9BACT|nr:hypothetical protein [Rhodopirellula sallentina]EMI53906.1 membrane protein [Rhodopirellula sallentina SM41]